MGEDVRNRNLVMRISQKEHNRLKLAAVALHIGEAELIRRAVNSYADVHDLLPSGDVFRERDDKPVDDNAAGHREG